MKISNFKPKLARIVSTGLLAVGIPGMVALELSSAPVAEAATNHLCLNSAQSECLISNGPGNQVTIGTSGYANFTQVAAYGSWNGKQVYSYENGAGNCLRENNQQQVVLENGHCQSGDLADRWAIGSNGLGAATFENRGHTTDYMGTYGTSSGLPVYATSPIGGFYSGWAFK